MSYVSLGEAPLPRMLSLAYRLRLGAALPGPSDKPFHHRRENNNPVTVHDLDRHRGHDPPAGRQLRRPAGHLLDRDTSPGGNAPPGGFAKLRLQPPDDREVSRRLTKLPHQEAPEPASAAASSALACTVPRWLMYCGPSGRLTRKPLPDGAGSRPRRRRRKLVVLAVLPKLGRSPESSSNRRTRSGAGGGSTSPASLVVSLAP